jgi:coenzyme F420-reducing hydrogenase beta subunit
MTEFQSCSSRLNETVIAGGYCIGCGACAVPANSPFSMRLDAMGRFQAELENGAVESMDSDPERACPFSQESLSEDDLGRERFQEGATRDPHLGFFRSVVAGAVIERGFRDQGSSGGMGSWILCELMRRGLIDAALHVKPTEAADPDGLLFRYGVSRDETSIRQGAKSRYYPVEMSAVLRQVREIPGRYAIVGLPCMIKAVRQLMKHDRLLDERIAYCISLVCGHLKSARFADMLAWQMGIAPGNLSSINFRHKIADRKASQYGIEVAGMVDGQEQTFHAPTASLFGSNWGHGLFKYRACDYCDDVVGETADLSIGDAWLPQYEQDSRGTNLVIVRDRRIATVLREATESGRLALEPITTADAVASQDAGFRHRREGLAYRLALSERVGRWRPPKRVVPAATHLDRTTRRRLELRVAMADQSHEAFAEARSLGDFEMFRRALEPLIDEYRKTYAVPRWRALLGGLKNRLRRMIGAGDR